MLELRKVCKSYGENQVIKNFSHVFAENKTTVITGPSGCGKTTLIRLIAGLEKPDSGEIITNKKTFSMMFQENRLLPWLTAKQNIELVAEMDGILDKLELTDSADKYPAELSGGMNQRVALGRALAYKSDILILDEPFKALDEILLEKMINLILDEHGKRTIIIITHDNNIINRIADDKIHI